MEHRQVILVVDNEPSFGESMRIALEARSLKVTSATNKAKAQEQARAEKPDAVIIGTILPRGDAYLLHRWLKETPPFNDVPMIVIDAPVEKQLLYGWRKGEGLQCAADDFLFKPVEPKSVVPLVERMLYKATRKIKVLVADDHAIIREGIRALLGVQKDMQVVGEATDGRDAIEKTRQLSPDVVLMDIVMPGMNGIEATKRISREFGRTKVLMLSQYDDEQNVIASTEVGASGFIPKNSASTQLLSAIRSL